MSISANAFFSSLLPEERQELAALFHPVEVEAGERLFTQGSVSEGAYLIEEGALDLELALPGDDPVVIGRVASGDFLGEPALLCSARRNLSAVAVKRVRAQFIDRLDYQGLRHSFRTVSFKLMLEIARLTGRRLQEVNQATSAVAGNRQDDPFTDTPIWGASHPDAQEGCPFDPAPYLPLLPFFKEFTAQDVTDLLSLTSMWEVPRGGLLVRAGEKARCCWIVIRGAVEALSPDTGMRVALFGPGDILGQFSPLLDLPATAHCRVREDAVVLEVGPKALDHLLRPASRASFKFVNGACLASMRGLQRANRVLARATKSWLSSQRA